MRAGFGKTDITPAIGTELAGFGYYLGRTAQSVIDPLYVRAVMLESEGVTSLIISCDLLGLSSGVCDKVREYAASLGCGNVMIVSVHTHCGPAIKYHEGCGYVCDEYVEKLPGLICAAVDMAMDDLSEVTSMTHTCIPVESDHIYNRAAADGPVDRNIRGFIINRVEKQPIAMVSGACHGVFRGRLPAVSADISGGINRVIDAAGYKSIYLNGLCGDIDPYKPDGDRLDEYANLVADVFFSSQQELPLTVENGTAAFTLQLTPVTREDIISAAAQAVNNAGGEDIPQAKVAVRWKEEMLEKIDRLVSSEDITVRYMLLGGVPVMALPFEGFTRIGMDIRSICGREDALILGCADELLGYLPTKDDISRGSYAALESTFLYKRLPVVPGEAERLGLEMGNALKAAWERTSETLTEA